MFVGHYALAFAAKRAVPGTSLGALFLAAQWVDLIWPVFLLVGLERVRIVPNDNPFLRLAFEWYPWTHSLVTGLLWAVLIGTAYALLRRDRRGGIVVGALVVSHWVLDWFAHLPDLPIYPGGPVTGLGLWQSFTGTMVVEGIMLAAGGAVYIARTRPVDRTGRHAVWALVAFLVLLYLGNAYAPPPPNVSAVAWGALAGWLLPVFGWWVDAHQAPTRV